MSSTWSCEVFDKSHLSAHRSFDKCHETSAILSFYKQSLPVQMLILYYIRKLGYRQSYTCCISVYLSMKKVMG